MSYLHMRQEHSEPKINNFDVKTQVSFVTGILTHDSTRGGGKGDTALQPVKD